MYKVEVVFDKEYNNIKLRALQYSNEINSGFLSPCYKPPVNLFFDYIKQLFTQYSVSLNDIKSEMSLHIPTKYKVVNDVDNWICMLLIRSASLKNDNEGINLFNYMFGMKSYAQLLQKYIRYCYDTTFEFAFSKLKANHLFIRFGSITNAINYLGQAIIEKRSDIFKAKNIIFSDYADYMIEMYNRLKQSVKSFTSAYMNAYRDTLVKEAEEDYNETNIFSRNLVNNIIMNYLFDTNLDIVKYVSSMNQIGYDKLLKIITHLNRNERTGIESLLFMLVNFNSERFFRLNDYSEVIMYVDDVMKLRNPRSTRKAIWIMYDRLPVDMKYDDASDTIKRYTIKSVAYYYALLLYNVRSNFNMYNRMNVKF